MKEDILYKLGNRVRSLRKEHKLTQEQLAYKDLNRICLKLSKSTGVKFTAHVLRHIAATELLNNGMDIYKVSKILGHTDIKTTTIYLHVATKNLQESMNELELYV